MREVRFVDTSVLCDLLDVPGKNQHREAVQAELRELVAAGVQLVLPIAAIIEAGNHIVHLGDGSARRMCATRFVHLLRATAEGTLPWVLHAVAWNDAMLHMLCDGTALTGPFVELAASGMLGTGDLSILVERDMYARRTAGTDVRVWTHDQRLGAYNP
jgi:hypothetical protein